MPPKRLHTTVAPTPTPTPPPSAPPPPSTTDPDNAVPKKKPKHDKDDQTDAVDTRPMCRYGVNCYRRNPQHFIEYRHPTKPSDLDAIRSEHEMMKEKARQAKLRSSSSSLSSSSTSSLFDTKTPPASPPSLPTPTSKPKSSTPKKSSSTLGSILDPTKVDDSVDQTKIESYKIVLQSFLYKNKIGPQEKQVIRTARKSMNIQDSVHRMLLGQFGWSEDEYEDGEKAESNDVDLDEENTILADPDGFKVIWVEKDKYPSKQHENVFSRVCSKFYQTMAKAQRNFQVTKVGIIVNTKLKARYDQKKAKLMEEGNDKEEWGFHGTSEDTIMKIAKTGFLHPDQIAKINAAATSKKSSKKKSKQPPPIAVLDDGYFGAGIYFSCYSDYAMWYSEEKDSEQVLLTKLLPGKAYKCTKRMDGSKCMSGYDSHFSPKGNEIIMFDPKACLPRYIIAYKSQEEEEREQES